MAGHGYETGRLDLPFVGISTFGKRPYVSDWSALQADVAVLGAPFDAGTQWRSGAVPVLSGGEHSENIHCIRHFKATETVYYTHNKHPTIYLE